MSVSLGRRLPHARGRGLSGIGRRASSARVRGTVAVGSAALVIGVLAWPMLLTSSGLGGDWEHHLWYVWQQSLAIRANGSPSLFLSTSYSVLYPQYAFYGGTINVIAGALSLALGGSPIAAYVLTYVLAFAAAYGGWCWLARAAGLGRWPAQAPALLFVTSACYLTLVYGQGDWAEFIAVSMIPLIVAAGAAVLRAEQLRLLPAVVLAAGSVVFFGSHDLTVLWASTIAIAVTGALLVCVPQVRRMVRPGVCCAWPRWSSRGGWQTRGFCCPRSLTRPTRRSEAATALRAKRCCTRCISCPSTISSPSRAPRPRLVCRTTPCRCPRWRSRGCS